MGGGASAPQGEQRDGIAQALADVRATHASELSLGSDEIDALLKVKEAEKEAAAAAEDYERCGALRDELAALREQRQGGHTRGDQHVFLVKSPRLPSNEALAFFGDLYNIQGQGRGHGITLGGAKQALTFVFDGPADNCAIRLADDKGLALEVNHRKMAKGSPLSLWECEKGGQVHHEWACKFSYNADCTLSPAGDPDVVVGVEESAHAWQLLQLVPRGDAKALIFEGGDVIDERWAVMERERAVAAASSALNVKLAGAVCADPSFRRE